MKTKTSVILVTLSMLSGCGGGQTGDLSGENDETGGQAHSECEETATELGSLDEVTPLGFSAREVLEFSARRFETEVQWPGSPDVSFGPESGRGTLTLDVTYAGGRVEYIESELKSDGRLGGPAVAGGGACNDRVRARVSVGLKTSGGAFDEAFEADLEARSRHAASFTSPLDLMRLQGSFAITGVTPPNAKVKQFGVDATLTPVGATGKVASVLEVEHPGAGNGGSVSARWITYAAWPADLACATPGSDSSGFAVTAADRVISFTGAQMIERFNAASPHELRWSNGESTELTLAATTRGDGCVRISAQFGELLEATYPVLLRATTSDGRLAGEYASALSVRADTEGNVTAISSPTGLSLTPDEAAASGLTNLGDLSAYDLVSFWLNSHVLEDEVTGFLQLNGIIDSQPAAPSDTGATTPSFQPIAIERATWK